MVSFTKSWWTIAGTMKQIPALTYRGHCISGTTVLIAMMQAAATAWKWMMDYLDHPLESNCIGHQLEHLLHQWKSIHFQIPYNYLSFSCYSLFHCILKCPDANLRPSVEVLGGEEVTSVSIQRQMTSHPASYHTSEATIHRSSCSDKWALCFEVLNWNKSTDIK